MVLLGAVTGSIAFTAGCGGSVEEGTSTPFNVKADMPRQDAMRAAMMKDKGAGPKGAKNAPKQDQKVQEEKKEPEATPKTKGD